MTESLKGVYDIERLASRVSFGKANPKDLIQLGHTLAQVPIIKAILESFNDDALSGLLQELDALPELESLIRSAIDPDAPATITEGGIIRDGFDETLDKYRKVMSEGTSWIADIEAKEREASGITTLKIDYNRKDGYYFHVTNSNLSLVPDHFFRKATLKNSERFGTAELAKIEGEMLEAREKSSTLEYDIFMRVREQVERYIDRLQSLAKAIATVDVLQSLAVTAETNHYVRPVFNDEHRIAIDRGRHAVVEKVMGVQEYIPNTITFDSQTNIQLITGPNMSQAIKRATPNSLIIFDELGRGTATYDGMALAQSIIEFIHDKVGAKTMFATHYHELTALSNSLTHLVNVHVATLEKDGEVTFLHKIVDGPADKSYGIHVAKIAGLPTDLLNRADTILTQLEGETVVIQPQEKVSSQEKPAIETHVNEQISLFDDFTENPVLQELRDLDIYNMTPMQVMMAVADLKQKL